MTPPTRQPLDRRSSFGNSQKLPSADVSSTTVPHGQISKRRSSFIVKGSGIEAVIPNEQLQESSQYPDPLDTPVESKYYTLAKKTSLNGLNISKTRSFAPRLQDSTSSFADRIDRESFDKSFTRQSDVMTDPQDIAIDVGDSVEVPGGITGTVKFLGVVRGKKGMFAGVELDKQYASRGKNDGDVEGYVACANLCPPRICTCRSANRPTVLLTIS